jgi:hypothetical protein
MRRTPNQVFAYYEEYLIWTKTRRYQRSSFRERVIFAVACTPLEGLRTAEPNIAREILAVSDRPIDSFVDLEELLITPVAPGATNQRPPSWDGIARGLTPSQIVWSVIDGNSNRIEK